ncbi:MAG: GspE/PulE family protein [Syntrophales bacterium LBB04]|nr:GspE/PulE family protein [Syntrophales bacterium LBB04]
MIIKKRLGEMLVESKLLTAEKLEKALADQKNSGLKLGQFLTRQGIVSEMQIVDMLCVQLKIGRYHPDRFPMDQGLSNVISYEAAQKYQVAPLLKKGRLLTIAMCDPLDINAMDSIEVLSNNEVEPIVCTEMELTNLHRSIYAAQAGLGGVVEGLEDLAYEKEEEQSEDIQVEAIQSGVMNTPAVIRLVNSIFSNAIHESASDIHISPQQNTMQVRFRIDGKLHGMPSPPKSMFPALVARIKILADMDITQSRIPQDGRFSLKLGNKVINVRASTVPTIHGENLVMRLLDTSGGIFTLDRLGMSAVNAERIGSIINKPFGMILSTGPTGSGKTSSLYAILQEINKPDVHIITLEDPVEYKIDSIRQIQLNVKAGMTFAGGLRAILRQDPDVIMVGEIRDGETASIAVRAAQTGHRLLSTMHTNDAAGAVARLVDMGIEPFLVSSTLLAAFAQRLIRTVCPYCREPYEPPAKAVASWGLDKVKDAVFMHGKGCQQCMQTGFKGRTGIFEVLVNDEVIQELILKKVSAQEITREAVLSGRMRTLQQDAADKVVRGITTLEEAEATVIS